MLILECLCANYIMNEGFAAATQKSAIFILLHVDGVEPAYTNFLLHNELIVKDVIDSPKSTYQKMKYKLALNYRCIFYVYR